MGKVFNNCVDSFTSLEQCVYHISNEYNKDDFLFRGERTDRYLCTTSVLHRIREDLSLPPNCRMVTEEYVKRLHVDLQKFLDLSPEHAMAFLQHYEVPTELLDLTSSIPVAAYFAAAGEIGSNGLVAVIPRIQPAELVDILDITRHPKANRPRKQSAFTFYSNQHKDLKSKESISKLKINWFKFTLQKSDIELYGSNSELLDAHTDEVAGVVQLLLDDYGKTNDWTAKLLADRVAAAPFILKVVREARGEKPIEFELVSTDQAGLEYDEVIERFNNRRIWSTMYKETRGRGGLNNLRSGSNTER